MPLNWTFNQQRFLNNLNFTFYEPNSAWTWFYPWAVTPFFASRFRDMRLFSILWFSFPKTIQLIQNLPLCVFYHVYDFRIHFHLRIICCKERKKVVIIVIIHHKYLPKFLSSLYCKSLIKQIPIQINYQFPILLWTFLQLNLQPKFWKLLMVVSFYKSQWDI